MFEFMFKPASHFYVGQFVSVVSDSSLKGQSGQIECESHPYYLVTVKDLGQFWIRGSSLQLDTSKKHRTKKEMVRRKVTDRGTLP